jgi:hypothetical protein
MPREDHGRARVAGSRVKARRAKRDGNACAPSAHSRGGTGGIALGGTANWTGVGGLRRNFLWSFLWHLWRALRWLLVPSAVLRTGRGVVMAAIGVAYERMPSDAELVSFVLSKNLRRHQLTTSQRAFFVAGASKIQTQSHGDFQRAAAFRWRRTDTNAAWIDHHELEFEANRGSATAVDDPNAGTCIGMAEAEADAAIAEAAAAVSEAAGAELAKVPFDRAGSVSRLSRKICMSRSPVAASAFVKGRPCAQSVRPLPWRARLWNARQRPF